MNYNSLIQGLFEYIYYKKRTKNKQKTNEKYNVI